MSADYHPASVGQTAVKRWLNLVWYWALILYLSAPAPPLINASRGLGGVLLVPLEEPGVGRPLDHQLGQRPNQRVDPVG
jgi:hypothetical protein